MVTFYQFLLMHFLQKPEVCLKTMTTGQSVQILLKRPRNSMQLPYSDPINSGLVAKVNTRPMKRSPLSALVTLSAEDVRAIQPRLDRDTVLLDMIPTVPPRE